MFVSESCIYLALLNEDTNTGSSYVSAYYLISGPLHLLAISNPLLLIISGPLNLLTFLLIMTAL